MLYPYAMDDRSKFVSPHGNPKPGAHEAYAAAYDADDNGRDPRQMTAAELRALGHAGQILAAVRQNCVECCGGNQADVRRCRLAWCPMWPYRMGSNPFHRREVSDEQRAALAARFSKR